MIRLNNRGQFNDVSALILRSQTITKNVFHSVFLHIPIISRSWIGVEKAGNHELQKRQDRDDKNCETQVFISTY